jgi:hypothetical protein
MKDVTEHNSHLIAQKDNTGKSTEAFKKFRVLPTTTTTTTTLSTQVEETSPSKEVSIVPDDKIMEEELLLLLEEGEEEKNRDNTIPREMPRNSSFVFMVSASSLAKCTGLYLKPAAQFFKNSTFGKTDHYLEFQHFVEGKSKHIDNFQTNWGNLHEPNALANVMMHLRLKLYQVGMKRKCIDPSRGIYASATPDFCWEHPTIEGLMGTGEAKSRSPLIQLDNGTVLNLSEKCTPFDEIPYYYVVQGLLQAYLFSMLYYIFTSWSENNGNTTFLFGMKLEVLTLAFDIVRFVVEKYIIGKRKYDAKSRKDPFADPSCTLVI